MNIEYQIKMIDDLIAENRESTIKDFVEVLKDIEEIEKAVMINKAEKTIKHNYTKVILRDLIK